MRIYIVEVHTEGNDVADVMVVAGSASAAAAAYEYRYPERLISRIRLYDNDEVIVAHG